MIQSQPRRPGNRFGFTAAGLFAAVIAGCSGGSNDAGGNGARGPGSGQPDGGLLLGVGGNDNRGRLPDGGFVPCTGTEVAGEQVKQTGPLDIYLVFDRTASMGQDCAFTAGTTPPVASKACYATYAVAEYFMSVDPASDTQLAFQFMSLATDDCNGTPYATPLIDMTKLPVPETHPLVQAISNENFVGGLGTHIEGAIRGLSTYTTAHDKNVGAPAGRTTIGILMTDGDPNGCDENVANLAQLVTNHFTATNGAVKMFFIGETGATLANLEQYAVAGGAAPHTDFCGGGPSPCHYWDVGDGKPDAFLSAMKSIVGQATVSHPLPCTFEVPAAPAGQTLDTELVNVNFTDSNGKPLVIYRVASKDACDATTGGWYYDDPTTPKQILLCDATCSSVGGSVGANVSIELGCSTERAPTR